MTRQSGDWRSWVASTSAGAPACSKKAAERELPVLKFASQGLVDLAPAGIIRIIEKTVEAVAIVKPARVINDRVKTYAADRDAGCDRATNLRRKVTTAVHHAKYFAEHGVSKFWAEGTYMSMWAKSAARFWRCYEESELLQDKKAKAASRGTLPAARYCTGLPIYSSTCRPCRRRDRLRPAPTRRLP